jgi:hypothetical protein
VHCIHCLSTQLIWNKNIMKLLAVITEEEQHISGYLTSWSNTKIFSYFPPQISLGTLAFSHTNSTKTYFLQKQQHRRMQYGLQQLTKVL